MKDKKVLFFVIIAVICLLLGVIGKIAATKILVQGYTWHELTQTFLLFGIAWGIGNNFYREVKE